MGDIPCSAADIGGCLVLLTGATMGIMYAYGRIQDWDIRDLFSNSSSFQFITIVDILGE